MAADDSQTRVDELLRLADGEYAQHKYGSAADLYSQAAGAQAELHGEMAPQNADLLFAYGRCLYKVAIAKSDVLGGNATAKDKADKKRKRDGGGESKAGIKAEGDDHKSIADEDPLASKPFFEISGDDNWVDSDGDSDGEVDGGADVAEDELATAYEVLDLARVLLSRKLDTLLLDAGRADSTTAGDDDATLEVVYKGKHSGTLEADATIRNVKQRLADTHDLLAEISLENEHFSEAIADSRAALAMLIQIAPFESAMLTEAHYKLSLALEFASVTELREAERARNADPPAASEDAASSATNGHGKARKSEGDQVDMGLRKQAVEEMELAIASLEARLTKETKELPDLAPDKRVDMEKRIGDGRSMLDEMKQRVRLTPLHFTCALALLAHPLSSLPDLQR